MLRVDRHGRPDEFVQSPALTVALTVQLSELGGLGQITDWGGKIVGAVARIAALLHLATHAGSAAPWETPLAEDTIGCAVQIGHFLIGQQTEAAARCE